MRLTLALFRWPKSRPNGNIWIGKHRMVRKVENKHIMEMWRDVEREKTNAFICLHPAISKEEEAAIFEKMEKNGPRPDQVWFQMRRLKVEGQQMAPQPLSQHFKTLRKEESW